METIVLFDPGIRSLNKGDEIIMKSAENELNKVGLLDGKYVIKSATHAPIVTWYQNTSRNPRMRVYDNAQYKFICGSNLMWKNLLKPRPVFNVNLMNCRPYKNSIMMGVGLGQSESKLNAYTRKLYSNILSKDYIHSVRDDASVEFLHSMGYKAINTGCPTMWKFTTDFCNHIPTKKASNVVFTLTDYGKEKEYDQRLIDILVNNYKEVYFWIQGVFDYEYISSFKNIENIRMVDPDVSAYSKILSMPDIEYVGTRLHAGMYAMQHQKRTIIISIDNRVRDLNAAYDLNVIERHEIEKLPSLINSEFVTDIKLKQENIDTWLNQFI